MRIEPVHNNNPPRLRMYATLLMLGMCMFAEAQPAAGLNHTDAKGRKQGPWEKVHAETGKPAYRTTFKDDEPVGTTERYFEDGSLQARIRHRKDGTDLARIFYPEGGLMATGVYRAQQRDSTWLFFGEDSVLTAEEQYNKGQKHGLSRAYYSDGSLSEKTEYKEGMRNGVWEQYYPDGNLRLKATVREGIAYDGEYLSNYANGKPMLKGRYEDGKREGSWYHYHEDGSIEVIYVYRGGKVESEHPQNGTFDAYYNNDIPRNSYTYKNGKKNGPFKEYYNQGEWRTEEAKDEFGNARPVQKLHGTQVMREGKYLEGELHGELVTYTEKGKVKSKEMYERGVKVK